MTILAGLLWASLTATVMFLTVKFYLPKLGKRNESAVSETLASVSSNEYSPKFMKKNVFIAIAFASTMTSGLCGYWLASRHPDLTAYLRFSAAAIVLIFAAVCDLEFELIPNISVVALIALRLVIAIPESILNVEKTADGLMGSLLTGLVVLVFLLLMSAITRGGIGNGDIKLFTGLGFMCDLSSVVITFIMSTLLCAVLSGLLLILKKKGLKDTLPMAPFIWTGFMIAATVI